MKKIIILMIGTLLIQSCHISDINGQQIIINEVKKTFSDIKSLEINGSFCDVQIEGENSSSTTFHGVINANKKRNDIKIQYEISGSVLKVWIDKPNSIYGNIGGNLTFKIPQQLNVKVENSSGKVDVTNMAKGQLILKASSGSIQAENIDSDLEIGTSSGKINAIAITGSLKAYSSSGDQNLQHISGVVKTSSSSGSITITNVGGNLISKSTSGSQYIMRATNGTHCEASSGSIKLEDSNGNIFAQTSSGSIRLSNITGSLQLGSSSGSQSGNNITLTENSSFSTSSGSIQMGLINNAEDLSFELNASSGGLNAKGISAENHLKISKGPILIKGQSSSGSQSYE